MGKSSVTFVRHFAVDQPHQKDRSTTELWLFKDCEMWPMAPDGTEAADGKSAFISPLGAQNQPCRYQEEK